MPRNLPQPRSNSTKLLDKHPSSRYLRSFSVVRPGTPLAGIASEFIHQFVSRRCRVDEDKYSREEDLVVGIGCNLVEVVGIGCSLVDRHKPTRCQQMKNAVRH